jgi:hypothetical protein
VTVICQPERIQSFADFALRPHVFSWRLGFSSSNRALHVVTCELKIATSADR